MTTTIFRGEPSRALSRLLAALFAFTLIAAACGEDDPVPAAAVDSDRPQDEPDMADSEMDADHDDAMADHDHGATIKIETVMAPTVAIEVFSDTAGGVNIHVTSTDFRVTPEAASTDPVEGEGHYHLYVDGEKVLRFYNDWIYYAGAARRRR